MKKSSLVITTALSAIAALALASCETATGTGALVGAATGAAIASNTGPHGYYRDNGGRTLAGAAIGAGAGALIGAAIDANRAAEYGPVPEGGYRVARWSETPGFVRSPCPPNALIDVRGIPRGSLVRDPSSGCIFRRP
ncbi:MAG: glycine zipper domain-containing protein [Chthoniobacterales bacterium]